MTPIIWVAPNALGDWCVWVMINSLGYGPGANKGGLWPWRIL